MTERALVVEPPIEVTRWPTERPLRALVTLMAIVVWILLAFSLIGIVYAVLLGLFFLRVLRAAWVQVNAPPIAPPPAPQPAPPPPPAVAPIRLRVGATSTAVISIGAPTTPKWDRSSTAHSSPA